ncbi:MAG TPA: choice-of-anchor tandem repeat GloVer-containing protein [Candidatus Binatia bacterium]|nr:choice-of-anchor tandem repeat GloVer-containing protein [Candidatus Binatia bacterium]
MSRLSPELVLYFRATRQSPGRRRSISSLRLMMKHRLLFPTLSLILFVAALSLKVSASTETILHSFSPQAHGVQPSCIISDSAGNFYVCAGGGTYGFGVIAKFSPNSQGQLIETVLYDFADTPDGALPFALLLDGSGNLWGLTGSGGVNKAGTFFELTPTAHGLWKESVLYSFPNIANGYLSGGLAEDQSGNFYGTTQSDGCCGSTNYGSVFQLANSGGVWTENVIHTFTNGSDGGRPYGRLTVDQAGNIYGTTFQGGVGNKGLVFEFVPASGGAWTENVLYDFVGGSDGSGPQSAVIFDQSGNLYGTTVFGGGGCGSRGCGTVYELLSGSNGHWTDKILDAFTKQAFSGSPQDLIFDSAGNLYGSSYTGGPGYGFVFELSPEPNGSWTETTLWTFKERGDGGYPTDVLLGGEGQLYGATNLGGNSNLDGSIFELQVDNGKWDLTTLYGFPPNDGGWPYATLIFDGSGNLYGTTSYGGLQNLGAVFKVSPAGESWKESLIYSFAGVTTSSQSTHPA